MSEARISDDLDLPGIIHFDFRPIVLDDHRAGNSPARRPSAGAVPGRSIELSIANRLAVSCPMNAVTKGNREISELMLTAVTKFRVSFGEVVDMERNFATMELTHYA